MKKILFFCLLAQALWAQPRIIPSAIDNVTLFLKGAQITRSARISLPAGKTELLFRDISPQINTQSIQVKSEGKFTILSVYHQLGNLSDKIPQDEIQGIETRKQQLEDKISVERNQLLVYRREEDMLLKNQVIGSAQSGLKVADLKESIEYQRQRMQEVLGKKLEIEKTITKLEAEIKKLNQLLTQINTKKETQGSEIVITVSAREAVVNAPVSISYFVQNAGWTPTYDFRIDKLSQPLGMAYKANAYQYSGEDWKDVRLTLSTVNPYKSATAPVLQKWVLGQENDYSDYYNNINLILAGNLTEVSGKVTLKKGKEPVPGATVILKGTSLGTSTDVNGNYRLHIPPDLALHQKILVCSMVGMKTCETAVTSGRIDIKMEETIQNLQEVVVTGYATSGKLKDPQFLQGRAAGLAVGEEKSTIPLDITENEAPTSQSFDILIPYSVPSDGRVYTIEIKEESIPAVFEHFCIPKIDTDVFLNAYITDWEKYRLLPGEASLFVENTFIGKSTLNLSNKDTLALSFGRDKNVIVSRIKLKSYQKKQILGSNRTEQFSYEIVARNTKSEAINLLIEDQFPMSNNREITVEGKEAPEAEINQETGIIRWKLHLAPAREYKVRLGYIIRSPK